jgi:hypothetical protein
VIATIYERGIQARGFAVMSGASYRRGSRIIREQIDRARGAA